MTHARTHAQRMHDRTLPALTEQNVFFAGCQQRHLRDALTGRDNNNQEKEEEEEEEAERQRVMISSTHVASETKPSHIAVRCDAMRLRSLLHSSLVQFSSVLSVQFHFCFVVFHLRAWMFGSGQWFFCLFRRSECVEVQQE